MKNNRYCSVFLVGCFLIAILAPLLFVNTTAGRVSAAENRALAAFPKFFADAWRVNPQFITQFEKWFNDNLGFRDEFVIANTKMQYHVFGRLTKTDTLLGKEQWTFYVNPDVIRDYQHLNTSDVRPLEQWKTALAHLDQYMKAKSIPFVMMLLPDKKTVYPEYYPPTIHQIGKTSRSDLLSNLLATQTSVDFLYLKDTLLQAKQKTEVYSPRIDNAHWNSYGAFVGYQALIGRVQKYHPNVRGLSWADVDVSRHYREIKVYNAIPLAEMEYSVRSKRPLQAVQVPGAYAKLKLNQGDQCFQYLHPDKKLPRALIFGDSYFYGQLIPFLGESFAEMNFIHISNMGRFAELVDLLKPDIVVFEVVERMLDGVMPYVVSSWLVRHTQ